MKINFDRHNKSFVKDLYDLLIFEGLHDKVDIKLEAIAEQIPGTKVAHKPTYIIPPESVELADTYIQLMIEAKKRGIESFKGYCSYYPMYVLFPPWGTYWTRR